jgi:hypothetical protein
MECTAEEAAAINSLRLVGVQVAWPVTELDVWSYERSNWSATSMIHPEAEYLWLLQAVTAWGQGLAVLSAGVHQDPDPTQAPSSGERTTRPDSDPERTAEQ